MMNYQSASDLRKLARFIEKAGATKGRALKLGEALDALAQGHGAKAWSALAPRLSAAGINASLRDSERLHVRDAEDLDYGPECVVQAHTGFFLKTPAYPLDCDYVRICDPLGRETSYWTADEWEQAPGEVMGAIVGALQRGVSAKPAQPSEALTQLPFGIKVSIRGAAACIESGIAAKLTAEDEPQDTRPKLIADTMEALLLAMASEGVDLEDPKISRAIETAVQSLCNNVF